MLDKKFGKKILDKYFENKILDKNISKQKY